MAEKEPDKLPRQAPQVIIRMLRALYRAPVPCMLLCSQLSASHDVLIELKTAILYIS